MKPKWTSTESPTPPDGIAVRKLGGRDHVLVIEDDEPTARFIEAHLAAAGCRVTSVNNLDEARRLSVTHQTDLVLMSATLALEDGFVTFEHLRSPRELERIPPLVVFLISPNDQLASERAFATPADGYLTKPIHEVDLLLRARSLLKVSRMASELEVLKQVVNEQRRELAGQGGLHGFALGNPRLAHAAPEEPTHVEPALDSELKELRQRHTDLERRLRDQRDSFLFLVHDLGGPMCALANISDFLMEHADNLPLELYETIHDVARAANLIRESADDLLAVAQGDERGLNPRVASTQLWSLVDEVFSQFEFDRRTRDISLSAVIPTWLWLDLDPGLIRRVLRNLIGNAVRFTQRGGQIEVTAHERAGEVRLALKHTGKPIAPEVRERLFERFSPRVDRESWRGGLGLHFCQRTIEAHGGTIELVDREGWAVCFEIALPQHALRAGPDVDRPRVPSGVREVAPDAKRRNNGS